MRNRMLIPLKRRKTISWILILALTMALVPAIAPPTAVVAADEKPVFTAALSDWTGVSACVGDKVFYVEAVGTNITDDYEGVWGVYDNNDPLPTFTPLADQTGHWYLGSDKDGKERHLYQLTMAGGAVLKSSDGGTYIDYYFRLTNDDGASYCESSADYPQFNIYDRYPGSLDAEEFPAEVAADTAAFPYSLELYYSPVTAIDDFTVSLVSGTKEDMWSPMTETGVVAISDDVALVRLNNAWRVSGTFAPSGLTAGTQLFVKIDYTGVADPSYSMSSIRVLGPSALGQFTLSGAVASRSAGYGGQGHGHGSVYAAADDATFYLAGGIGETAHTFTLTGTALSAPAKLAVSGGTLVPGSVQVSSAGGVYTLTGGVTIPAGDGSLVFSYDGAVIHTVPLDRSTLKPGSAPYATAAELASVADDGAVTVKLSGFNLPATAAAYAGELLYYDAAGSEVTIGFPCTALSASDGVLTLTLTPDGPLPAGGGLVGLLCNGDALEQSGYNYDDSGDLTALLNDGYTGVFVRDFKNVGVFQAGTASPALLGVSGGQDLTLSGIGFVSSSAYTAYFMERTAAGLAAAPAALAATYVSPTTLTISAELTSGLARGWYEVYLMAGNTRIAGFVSAALLPGDAPTVETPTVRVPASVTAPAITISITSGSYSSVRVAESAEALSSAAWQAIGAIPFTLSAGYGAKTLYFEFKDDSGTWPHYNTTAAVVYRSAATLPAPAVYGVSGVEPVSGSLALYTDTDYTVYIKDYPGEGFVGHLDMLAADNAVIQSVTLGRTAKTAAGYTYTKKTTIAANAQTLNYYLIDSSGASTLAASRPVTVQDKPVITAAEAPVFPRTRDWQGYIVPPNAQFQFGFTGTPGQTATATIVTGNDTNDANTPVTLAEIPAGSGYYRYSGSISLPVAAVALKQITYTLTDGKNPFTKEYTYTDHRLSPRLKFTGLDSSYAGAQIQVKNSAANSSYYYRVLPVPTTGDDIVFIDLTIGGAYDWTLIGDYGAITSGSVTIGSNVATVDLGSSVIPAAGTLTFNLNHTDATPPTDTNIQYSYHMDGRTITSYAAPGTQLRHLPAGTAVSYELILPYDQVRNYQPVTGNTTIAAGANPVNIEIKKFDMVTLRVAVTNNITGAPLAGATVTATQQDICDAIPLSSSSAVTDASGATLTLYKDIPADISITARGYRPETVENVSCASNFTMNKSLDYDLSNKITLDFMVYPLAVGDAAFEAPVRTGADNLWLKQVKDDGGNKIDTARYDWEYSSSGYVNYIRLANDKTAIYPDQTVTVDLSPGSGYVLDAASQNQSVKLNANGNGHLTVTGYHQGVISAKVSDLATTSYMLVFDAAGNRVGDPLPGTVRLSSESLQLKAGDYTVVVMRGEGLTRLNGLRSLAALEALVDATLLPTQSFIRRAATVVDGRITDLGELSPERDVINSYLGAIDVAISTEADPDKKVLYADAKISAAAGVVLSNISFHRETSTSVDSNYYVNGKSTGYSYSSATLPARAAFALGINTDNLLAQGSITVKYSLNGRPFTETFNISESVPLVTLSAPAFVSSGAEAQAVEINGLAPAGSTVDIYDGSTLIASVKADANASRYRASVSLLNPERAGSHSLWAELTQSDGTVNRSASVDCAVFKAGKMSYVSDFKWVHHNGWMGRDLTVELPQLSQINDAALTSLSYYPSSPSTISFEIQNLAAEDIRSAWLVNNYNGSEKVFAATYDGQVWTTGQVNLSYIGQLSVRYDLKTNDPAKAAILNGTTLPSVAELMTAANDDDDAGAAISAMIDPALLPAVVRDNASASSFTTLSQNSNETKVTQTVAGGATITNTFSYADEIKTPSQLYNDPEFLKVVTEQGTMWVKSELTETADGYDMKRTVYIENKLALQAGPELLAAAPNAKILLASSLALPGFLRAAAATDAALFGVEWSGHLTNAADLVGDLKDAAYVTEKFAKGMNILGAVGTVAKIAGGPSTKDPAILREALKYIENEATRRNYYQQIADYTELAESVHVSDCFSGSFFAGLGFIPEPTGITKGAALIGGVANSLLGMATTSEIDAMWDAIALGIQTDLQVEMMIRLKAQQEKEREEFEKEMERLDKFLEETEAFLNSCDALGHKFELIRETPATETAGGERVFRCERGTCGWETVHPTPALGKKEELIEDDPNTLEEEGPGPGTEEEIPPINVIIDPSGYVFEALETNRVAGINATVYRGSGGLDGSFAPWIDTIAGQANPQTTEADGRYGWDVPAGAWKVGFTGSGYAPAESKAMTVPPAHTQVNIGLMKTTAPAVTAAVITGNQLEVQFSDFMQMDSIYDANHFVNNIQVYDRDGGIVSGTVSFPVPADNTGYVPGDYQQEVIASDKFVKRAVFTPDASYVGGFRDFEDDGVTAAQYRVVVRQNALSYAGVRLAADYDSGLLTRQELVTLSTPTASPAAGAYSSAQTVTLSSVDTGAAIYYTLDGSEPTELSFVYSEPLDITETTLLRFIAAKPGADNSPLGEAQYIIDPTRSAPPTASPAPGSYSAAQTVTLSSTDAGAVIYYTTDGSTPTTSSAVYSAALSVSRTTTIKAFAVKSGMAPSTILSFTYTIDSGYTPSGGSSGGGGGGVSLPAVTTNTGGDATLSHDGKTLTITPAAGYGIKDVLVNGVSMGPVATLTDLKPTDKVEVIFERLDGGSLPFSDVAADAWYYEAVNYAYENGLFNGISATEFGPNVAMTRAMLVTVLYRLSGEPTADAASFSDVPSDTWYTDAVAWASQNGIVDGYGAGRFGPDDFVSREQMATILYRFARASGMDTSAAASLSEFTDAAEVSPWAAEALQWAVGVGLISGKGYGILDPTGSATRAEVATILMRYLENL